MTGLSVLYAKEAAEERDWAAIPDRDRTGRLREVYWARRADSKSGRKPSVNMNLFWRASRIEVGRGRNDPGDAFIYLVDMVPGVKDRFEWLEVTEVFTTVPAAQIEGAMRAWNGIPDNPFRVENAVDDFMTRTALGLEEVKQKVLRRRNCPFRNVIVIWDTTPQALREWRATRSAEYEDAVNASLENPISASLWEVVSEEPEKAISSTAIPESEASSMSLHLNVKTRKKASGKGPYPEFVEAFAEVVREIDVKSMSFGTMFKPRVALLLCKLFCFVRIHGVDGLERWIMRKSSVSYAWRAMALRRRARRFYRESRRRGRALDGPHNSYGVDGQRRWPRALGAARRGLDGRL